MGRLLTALLHLQSIERQLAQIRGRLGSRKNAVSAYERRIGQLRTDHEALRARSMQRRADADRLDLDLKQKEEQVNKFRLALNNAKTNREYASILTQINTTKADNARTEEEALKVMQEADSIADEARKLEKEIAEEQELLEEVNRTSAEEIDRLEVTMAQLSEKRAQAAGDVKPESLSVFERLAESYDGEAMAAIEIHGKRAPHDYVCGGCYMSLSAEHANALQTRDELRTCPNCGRILYLEPQTEGSPT